MSFIISLRDQNNIDKMLTYKQLLAKAFTLAANSPDPSTQNAAYLIRENKNKANFDYLGSGINTFPGGVKYKEDRLVRPQKYNFIEHAERMAIYDAVNNGHDLRGSTLVVIWGICSDCARAVIECKIAKVITLQSATTRSSDVWQENMTNAFTMLSEAGVEVMKLTGTIDTKQKILFNGEYWNPN